MEYLRALATSTTKLEREPDYEAQYRRLATLIDPNSSLEREFLKVLHDNRIRLPDNAQIRPTPKVLVQPDFYYKRGNRPGVCIFIDGPHHDSPGQRNADDHTRSELQDYGFSVITITHHRPIKDQVNEHLDVFVPVV